MTGFARGRAETDRFTAEVELRSVNHRFLEFHPRLPAKLAALESRFRQALDGRLERGKIDLVVRLTPRAESAYDIEVDEALAERFVAAARGLAPRLGLRDDLAISHTLALHQAFEVKERELGSEEECWEALRPAFEGALGELNRMREAEGRELAADLDRRLAAVEGALRAIESRSNSSREERRRELAERVRDVLAGAALDPAAVAMEVARLVERSDVSEEITRFRSHLALWNRAASGAEPCGKKLDFIVQEMNREANTIGAKCQDAAITEQVIAIKSELERIREQVQNIE
jgi:uncharacterized protein (TIGR00255 family)